MNDEIPEGRSGNRRGPAKLISFPVLADGGSMAHSLTPAQGSRRTRVITFPTLDEHLQNACDPDADLEDGRVGAMHFRMLSLVCEELGIETWLAEDGLPLKEGVDNVGWEVARRVGQVVEMSAITLGGALDESIRRRSAAWRCTHLEDASLF